uniref:Aryl hydrocarbon receptor n=1 Tax=Sphaeramia orbicularis TaxID=375764 RepID=A0A672YFW2_9TELE
LYFILFLFSSKRRKHHVVKKTSDGSEVVKSNPSKRHRDRLNGELDRLTELLPFPEDIRSRLDKLSVLRLSVGYLRVKSYFKATLKNGNGNNSLVFPGINGQNGNGMDAWGFSEGDLLLQALNGFVIVVTSEGLVFYTSDTIKDYLGFHQSDVVHQSVFDLIHTDDRALFKQQLHFAFNPPPAGALQGCGDTGIYSPDQLPPENSSFLERSFVCRFRCLLDNSSGFLALKFQGRLKYLHGQSLLRDNGTCVQPQLALFCIAVPVQPPSIVEIRAKMLLFQTKHRLDFTPTGVDSRGKIVLGYSEAELCSKGSGYQFIHAADMMYCADNHIRMIKTGESGLTVFRLLTKSGSWIWVKSNAKVIFKGGRPEFIIAYQKALVNAEGEDYLRQRRLQLPFSCTTGEAVLYNSSPTVDITEFQFNKMFNSSNVEKEGDPQSLLDCFLKQDHGLYSQPIESPLPVDQVFMDSRALVTIANDAWQGTGSDAVGDSVVVKEEAKTSVMAVIEGLEKMAQNGDFCAALQSLEVDDTQLLEWENTLRRLSDDQQNSLRSDLDTIVTNDIFDYIDSVLFEEKVDTSPPSCLSGVGNNLQEPFAQANPFPATGLSEPQMFRTPSPDCAYSPVNGLYAHQQDARGLRPSSEDSPIFNGTQKLSHPGVLQAEGNLPPIQQLQLQDIFSLAIELPELTVPNTSLTFASCGQTSSHRQGQPQPSQHLLCPQNNSQHPPANRQLLQSSIQQPSAVPSSATDILPPLIQCNDFNSPNTPNIPVPFSTSCLQGSTHFEPPNQQTQQWPQSQTQKLPHSGIMQNLPEPMQACHNQTSQSQTFPNGGHLPRSVNGLNHSQQGGLACGQEATHSSCMFDQPFSSGPAGDGVFTFSGSLCLSGAGTSLDQSPPQGSCYFQWGRSEPVVGTAAISQENVNISPLTFSSGMSSSDHCFNIQQLLECQRKTQVNMIRDKESSQTQKMISYSLGHR